MYTIKCKCGWDYPVFDTAEQAKKFAENELDSIIKTTKQFDFYGEEEQKIRDAHAYKIEIVSRSNS